MPWVIGHHPGVLRHLHYCVASGLLCHHMASGLTHAYAGLRLIVPPHGFRVNTRIRRAAGRRQQVKMSMNKTSKARGFRKIFFPVFGCFQVNLQAIYCLTVLVPFDMFYVAFCGNIKCQYSELPQSCLSDHLYHQCCETND